MTSADYLIKLLEDKGFDIAFTITGGQSMYINDALAKSKKIKSVFFHHEQSCVMAADAYTRASGKPSLVVVTAGPGSTNTLTGVIGAYLDSSAIVIVSGQSNYSDLMYQRKTNIRQFGVQGIDIKPSVINYVKDFYTINPSSNLNYQVDKIYSSMISGRRGPVWIEFPLDLQRAAPKFSNKLYNYHLDNSIKYYDFHKEIKAIVDLLKSSKRPLIIAGQGIRLSNTIDKLNELINYTNIPIITSRLGIDVIDSSDCRFVGRPGTYGDRAGNFIVQVADLIVVLGSRLSTSTIGYNQKNFGKRAKIVYIDLDNEELKKPNFKLSVTLNISLEIFLPLFYDYIKIDNYNVSSSWIESYMKIHDSFFTFDYDKQKLSKDTVNPYEFFIELSKNAKANSAILLDTGSCFHIVSQVWSIKFGQRFITTGGLSTMGYWPAGFGLMNLEEFDDVYIITGDGSLNMNLQELAQFNLYKKKVRLIILNNGGYLLIRKTQQNYMSNRLYGEGKDTGLWFPDIRNLAKTYNLDYINVNSNLELDGIVSKINNNQSHLIIELLIDHNHELIPRIASIKDNQGNLVSMDIENMYPFFDDEQLRNYYVLFGLEDLL